MCPRLSRLLLPTLALLGALPLSGCMLTRPQSGPTFSFVEEHLVPENRTAQYLLLPVFIPIGTAAALTDALVVHPAMIVDDVASDTHDALWDNLRWDETYMTESAALPWRTAATPVFFTGDFVGRVLFEIPRDAETIAATEDRREAEARLMAEARALLDEGKPGEALALLVQNHEPDWSRPQEEQQDYVLLIFRAALAAGRYERFEEYMRGPYYTVTATPEFKAMLETLAKSESPLARSVAFGWWVDQGKTAERDPLDVLHLMLNDESEAIRAQGLARIQPWLFQEGAPNPDLSVDLERIAESDASVFNREKAAAVLRQQADQASNRGPKF